MIDIKLLKNNARMSLKLNGTTEHVYGQISKSESHRYFDNPIVKKARFEMTEACRICRARLNLGSDKFEKSSHLIKSKNF